MYWSFSINNSIFSIHHHIRQFLLVCHSDNSIMGKTSDVLLTVTRKTNWRTNLLSLRFLQFLFFPEYKADRLAPDFKYSRRWDYLQQWCFMVARGPSIHGNRSIDSISSWWRSDFYRSSGNTSLSNAKMYFIDNYRSTEEEGRLIVVVYYWNKGDNSNSIVYQHFVTLSAFPVLHCGILME